MQKKIIFVFILLIAFVFFIMCSRGPGTTDSVNSDGIITISGSLDSTLYYAVSSRDSKSLTGAVTHIASFPVVTEGLGVESVQEEQEEPVEGTNFEISVDSGNDYLFALLDKDQPDKVQQLTGFISLITGQDNGTANSLIKFPITYASTDIIDLGLLSSVDDEAQSSNDSDLNSANFELSSAQLEELAKTDDTMKHLKNIYINYDAEAGTYYNVEAGFSWDHMPPDDITGGFSSPEQYTANSQGGTGMYFDIFTNDLLNNPTVQEIDNGEVEIGCYFEQPIQTEQLAEEIEKITNIFPDHSDFFEVRDEDGRFRYNMIADGGILEVPTGYTEFKKGGDTGTKLAQFDLELTTPLDSEGNYRIFVPKVKMNLQTDNITVENIEIQWTLYNPDTASYDNLDDPTILRNSISAFWPTIMINGNESPHETKEFRGNDIETYIVWSSFDSTWKWKDDGSADYIADGISIEYELGGTNYSWWWDSYK